MRKILVLMSLVAAARLQAAVVGPIIPSVVQAAGVSSTVTAEVTFGEEGDKLYGHVRLHGIAKGQVVFFRFRWTAPRVVYTTQKGEEVVLFSDTVLPDPNDSDAAKSAPFVAGDSHSGCFCKDSGEKGCWHGSAWRTLVTSLSNGKKVRAAGTWKLEAVREDGVVLGSAQVGVQ